jgi:hypothetical protein
MPNTVRRGPPGNLARTLRPTVPGRLGANLHYVNRSPQEWTLACQAAADDLRASYLTVTARQVYPVPVGDRSVA